MIHYCDYCQTESGRYFRAIGFLPVKGYEKEYPRIKMWCGVCETPKDIDPEATHFFLSSMKRDHWESAK